eukprot:1175870-Prorocentrum_minimum.AAC.6
MRQAKSPKLDPAAPQDSLKWSGPVPSLGPLQLMREKRRVKYHFDILNMLCAFATHEAVFCEVWRHAKPLIVGP